jgi:hypothetical protein
LKPVLEDDALILSLDELEVPRSSAFEAEGQNVELLLARNSQLEEELDRLQRQFDNYRLAVQATLDHRWGDDVEEAKNSKAFDLDKPSKPNNSDYYFESYAGNGNPYFKPIYESFC